MPWTSVHTIASAPLAIVLFYDRKSYIDAFKSLIKDVYYLMKKWVTMDGKEHGGDI